MVVQLKHHARIHPGTTHEHHTHDVERPSTSPMATNKCAAMTVCFSVTFNVFRSPLHVLDQYQKSLTMLVLQKAILAIPLSLPACS